MSIAPRAHEIALMVILGVCVCCDTRAIQSVVVGRRLWLTRRRVCVCVRVLPTSGLNFGVSCALRLFSAQL